MGGRAGEAEENLLTVNTHGVPLKKINSVLKKPVQMQSMFIIEALEVQKNIKSKITHNLTIQTFKHPLNFCNIFYQAFIYIYMRIYMFFEIRCF